jgi:hypothetical protein
MTTPSPRWNKYVPVEDPGGDSVVVVQPDSASTSPLFGVSPTPLMQQLRYRVTSFVVPFGIAAAFFGPATENVRRRVRLTTGTDAPLLAFPDLLDDVWTLHSELLHREDVQELERLWSLPYPGPVETDFRFLSE